MIYGSYHKLPSHLKPSPPLFQPLRGIFQPNSYCQLTFKSPSMFVSAFPGKNEKKSYFLSMLENFCKWTPPGHWRKCYVKHQFAPWARSSLRTQLFCGDCKFCTWAEKIKVRLRLFFKFYRPSSHRDSPKWSFSKRLKLLHHRRVESRLFGKA